MWRVGLALGLTALLMCGSAQATSVSSSSIHNFSLGNAKDFSASADMVRLQCLGRAADGKIYVTNVAIDRTRKAVWAYIPVLKIGLNFVDGRSGDAQYGENRVELPNLSQHVNISSDAVTIVNDLPTGGTSITVYDLVNNTGTALNNVVANTPVNTYKCSRVTSSQ